MNICISLLYGKLQQLFMCLTDLMFIQLYACFYLSAWSAAGWGHWSPALQEPSAQWAGHGSPSRGCSGPVAPSASQNGYGYLSESGSSSTQKTQWLFVIAEKKLIKVSKLYCKYLQQLKNTSVIRVVIINHNSMINNWNYHLIECMSYMRVSIGIRGSIMKTELLLGLPLSLPGVQICKSTLLPKYGIIQQFILSCNSANSSTYWQFTHTHARTRYLIMYC